MLPTLANIYVPVLVAQLNLLWPSMPMPSTLGAQIEQETCISLKSKGCWNPKTELKTDREYGFGLGQLTVTPRFNNFEAAKTWDKSLASWKWEDRFDATKQIQALIAYDRNLYGQIRFGKTVDDKLAFMFSAYNGGYGGVVKDRQICAATARCDKDVWIGNVELHSFRSRTAVKGYGQSFYDINRGYVRNVMTTRRVRYEFMDKK